MMNSIPTWTGRRNKPLTKIHVRPKRNLYSKLRQQTKKFDLNAFPSGCNDSEVATSTLNFLATDDDSEEEILTYELSKVKNLRANSNRIVADKIRREKCALETKFVEKEIEAGDTLHNLALRYGCKVSEMKRINNLINDQEFFGLRRIKVPVKEHGFAKEQLEKENELKMNNLARECAHVNMDTIGPCATNGSARLISIRDNRNAKEFLQQMDADLERIRMSTKTEKDTLEEVTMSLTCKRFHPFSEPKPHRSIPPLRILILVIILTLIAFPIIIILLMVYRRSMETLHSDISHFQKHANSS